MGMSSFSSGSSGLSAIVALRVVSLAPDFVMGGAPGTEDGSLRIIGSSIIGLCETTIGRALEDGADSPGRAMSMCFLGALGDDSFFGDFLVIFSSFVLHTVCRSNNLREFMVINARATDQRTVAAF